MRVPQRRSRAARQGCGRRVEKVYSTYDDVGEVWVAQATYRFVYDEWNVVMVLNDNNSTLRKYTWGLDLSRDHDPSRDREGAEGIHGAGGIGGLLAVEETAEQDSPAYWFFYDANGNVGQAIKASDQTIAAKYEYDPYGNVIASGGTYADDNPIRFSTKWFDTELAGAGFGGAVGESGLGYWGYRYYSARLGRWMNRDPIGELGGLCLYQYARNAPDLFVDSLGLKWGIDNILSALLEIFGGLVAELSGDSVLYTHGPKNCPADQKRVMYKMTINVWYVTLTAEMSAGPITVPLLELSAETRRQRNQYFKCIPCCDPQPTVTQYCYSDTGLQPAGSTPVQRGKKGPVLYWIDIVEKEQTIRRGHSCYTVADPDALFPRECDANDPNVLP